jgi:hypothetical protein
MNVDFNVAGRYAVVTRAGVPHVKMLAKADHVPHLVSLAKR